MLTNRPRQAKGLVIQLISALLQCITQPVVTVLTPGVNRYVLWARGSETALKELALFILEIAELFKTEEGHPTSMKESEDKFPYTDARRALM